MNAISLAPDTSPGHSLTRRLRDVAVLTGRNLVHIAREPLQLSDVTVQPILFTMLFVPLFGAGVVLPHGGSYTAFAIAGLLALNLTTSSMGTAIGLSTDLNGGVVDRFRTLPMWRPAVLVGRSLADLLTATLCALIVALTGLAIGWRPQGGMAETLAGFGVFLLFSYALSWLCACLGILSKGPESAQGIGLVILFPLASSPTRSSPPSTCPSSSARSPTGTPSAPSPRPPASSSTTRIPPRPSRTGRCSTHRHLAALVGRAPRDLRPARRPPLQTANHRVSRTTVPRGSTTG